MLTLHDPGQGVRPRPKPGDRLLMVLWFWVSRVSWVQETVLPIISSVYKHYLL